MPFHVMTRFESHRAKHARMAFDFRMLGVQMPRQIQMVPIQFLAHVALVFLFIFSVVRLHVVSQLAGYREGLVANLAFDLGYCCWVVTFDMHMQSSSGAELLHAELTAAFLIFGIMLVHPMHVQIMLVLECFVADVTDNSGVLS